MFVTLLILEDSVVAPCYTEGVLIVSENFITEMKNYRNRYIDNFAMEVLCDGFEEKYP